MLRTSEQVFALREAFQTHNCRHPFVSNLFLTNECVRSKSFVVATVPRGNQVKNIAYHVYAVTEVLPVPLFFSAFAT